MQYSKIFIFGIGGHSRVILSELLLISKYKSIVFVAHDKYPEKSILINNSNYEVINNLSKLKDSYDNNSCGIIGIGSIEKRILISNEVSSLIPNFKWERLLSKFATISSNVKIEEGTVIISGSIINTGTCIGKHCIINTNSSIDHDNIIGDYVNVSPTVVTGGSVKIDNASDIGIGSTIKNNITVGNNVVIGGHSFVNKDCESNSLYYGIPIKKIK